MLWDYCLLRILSTLLSEHKFRFFFSAFQKKTKHLSFAGPQNTCTSTSAHTQHLYRTLNTNSQPTKPVINNCKSSFLYCKYYFTEYFMHLLCAVSIIHYPFVMFKICRTAHTINLCLVMPKNKQTHMGKDLIEDLLRPQ